MMIKLKISKTVAKAYAVAGIINPITVRLSHPSNKAFKYILVAGERRMRACMLAGHPIIAQIIDVSEPRARSIQFAENIHREDLSIADKARAVRWIYDELGTMQAVADLVKKSKSWVSKLIAVSESDFGWRAKQLLEDGICEDLELLGVISQIEKSYNLHVAEDAVDKVRKGTLNRDEARELLRSLKEEEERRKKQEEEAKAKAEGVVVQLKNAKDEQKEARAEMERAERKWKLDEALRLDPLEVLQKLVKYYVITEEKMFDGDLTQVATEFHTLPLAGTGLGSSFQAFTDDEIKNAWRTAVESLAEHLGEPVTEAYYLENR